MDWHTVWAAMAPLLAELADDPDRLTGLDTIGVDEHMWHHQPRPGKGPKEMTGMPTDLAGVRLTHILNFDCCAFEQRARWPRDFCDPHQAGRPAPHDERARRAQSPRFCLPKSTTFESVIASRSSSPSPEV
jgi:hypothetical protein